MSLGKLKRVFSLGKLGDHQVAIAPSTSAFVVVILLCRLVPGASPFIYLCLIGLSLRSSRGTIQALFLSVILNCLNPDLFRATSFDGYLKWIIIFAAFSIELIRAVFRGKSFPPGAIYIVSFCLIAGMCSFQSRTPLISIMKLTAWFVGVMAIFLAYSNSGSMASEWMNWFSSVFFMLVLTGIPLYFTPLGYMPGDAKLYRGIFVHSQTLAAILTPAVAWFTALFIAVDKRTTLLKIAVGLGWLVMIATHARTSVVAIGCAIIFVTLFSPQRKRLVTMLFGNVLGPIILVTFAVGVYFFADNIRVEVNEFLTKGHSHREIGDAFMESRGGGIVLSLQNFADNPLMGIGFGAPSRPRLSAVVNDSLLGLPMSAPVEKGFLPSALLEELGIFGALPFIIFISRILITVVSNGDLAALFVLAAVLAVNLGECILFSIGGIGLSSWTLIGFALASSGFFAGQEANQPDKASTPAFDWQGSRPHSPKEVRNSTVMGHLE
jgi:hypothetical protein